MADMEKLLPFLPAFAVAVSVLSFVLSCTSLGWNIYRDIILKARVRVTFQVSQIRHASLREPFSQLRITVTNHGPGKVNCQNILYKKTSFFRRVLRRTELGVMLPDFEDPLSERLPRTLEVGERFHLLLPYVQNCCLSTGTTHVGIADSFGRKHWAPVSNVRRARGQFLKDQSTLPKTALTE